jgi:sortase (surface protein transpeptidase)
VRISGVYPPPLTPSLSSVSHENALGAPPRPVTTRYDRRRLHHARRSRRPSAARVWGGASVCLAVAAVMAAVLLPQHQAVPARLDASLPVAAVAAPGATSSAALAPPVPRAAPVSEALQLPASTPVRMQIPALGVQTRIMELGLERDGSMEVPPGAYPVGWYDGSPTPGQIGPSVLAGHVDWEGERGAFYGLRELLRGDEVVIERADGTMATFRVDRVEQHSKDDFPSEEVYGNLDHSGLRLITCGGAFDDDSGDYQANVIVFGSLLSVS